MRRLGGAIAVWWGIAAILGVLVAQMRDWFVMTDELLYERLALRVDRLHSPFPHVHGTSIANLNQLYPLVLAPVLAHGPIGDAVRNAHVVGAFAMTSAAVPAYLIARRYVRDAWAVVAALLCVVVPWTVLASFLLTSVVAYPATLWAVLAIVATLETPTRRNDVLALLAVAVAVTTRTQLAVLGLVLLLALVVRRDVRRHPLVLAGAGAAVLLALVAALAGHNPLGTYGETAKGNPFPWTTAPAVLTHLAAVGIGTALVPFVLGGAWLAG